MPATRAATSVRVPAMVAARPGSPADTPCSFRLEHRPDLLETGARAVPLDRLERVIAEPRQLEQPRQLLDRGARQREPGQRLEDEFARGLPGRSRHAGPRGEALEAPIAPDDGRPRVGLVGEIVEALLDHLAQALGRRGAIPALQPVGAAL